MIGEKQIMTYYTPQTGIGINSIEKIYSFIEQQDLEYITFLNESFQLETCKINRILPKRTIKKIEVETGTHYLSNEQVLVNGSIIKTISIIFA